MAVIAHVATFIVVLYVWFQVAATFWTTIRNAVSDLQLPDATSRVTVDLVVGATSLALQAFIAVLVTSTLWG